jgi:hypothetical protein
MSPSERHNCLPYNIYAAGVYKSEFYIVVLLTYLGIGIYNTVLSYLCQILDL